MSTNPTYKPSEGKREEFRKYLEKNGVMDALTKVLVSLYEEVDKPQDALAFIRDKLAIEAGLETYDQIMEKLQEAEKKVKELDEQVGQFMTTKTDQEEEEQQLTEPAELPVEGTEDPAEASAPVPPQEGVVEEQVAPPPTPAAEETPEDAPPTAPPEQ